MRLQAYTRARLLEARLAGGELELATVLNDAVERGDEELAQMAEELRRSLPSEAKAGESAQPRVVVGRFVWKEGGYPGRATVTVEIRAGTPWTLEMP